MSALLARFPVALLCSAFIAAVHAQPATAPSTPASAATQAARPVGIATVPVPVLADQVDADRLVEEVAVFRRGEGTPRYHNQLGPDGAWANPPGLRAAIETERDRPWTSQEIVDFLAVQSRLETGLGPAWSTRIAEIGQLAQPLMRPIPADASRVFDHRTASHTGPARPAGQPDAAPAQLLSPPDLQDLPGL